MLISAARAGIQIDRSDLLEAVLNTGLEENVRNALIAAISKLPPAAPHVSDTLSQLQLVINAIPEAHEGQPITPEYHNSLRAAFQGLMGFLRETDQRLQQIEG